MRLIRNPTPILWRILNEPAAQYWAALCPSVLQQMITFQVTTICALRSVIVATKRYEYGRRYIYPTALANILTWRAFDRCSLPAM